MLTMAGRRSCACYAKPQILKAVDHPFLASLWGTISTPTHLHFLMEPCSGGELYAVLNAQPHKRFPEATMRFYAAEVCPLALPDTAHSEAKRACHLDAL